MKYYTTLLVSLLMVSLGLAQEDPVTIIKNVIVLKDQTLAQMQANTDKTKNEILCEQFIEKSRTILSGIPEESYGYPPSMHPYMDKKGNFTRKFEKLLDKAGLWPAWDEGFTGFYFRRGYLAKIFKDYLPEEYILYLKINDIYPFMFGDAALGISWEDMGKQVLNQGNFIKRYPNSKRINEVKLNFSGDLRIFMYGAPNTPSSDDPQARKTLEKFVKKNPDALATPIIKIYLENTYVNQYGKTVYNENENIGELMEKELEKQLGTTISELNKAVYPESNF